MQRTRESRRAWWAIMLAAWSVAAALILAHTLAIRDYVALLDGLAGGPAEAATPLRQVVPARLADGQMWVRHTLDTQEAGRLRLHFTTVDNAPLGREVHWSSSLAWLLRVAAWLQGMFTGESGPVALEHAMLWLNAPLFLAVLIGFSAWVGGRAGAGAGLIVALAMIGHPRFYEGFMPAYIDHHGLVNAAAFGLIMGFAFSGAGGWHAPGGGFPLLPDSGTSARRAATVSAGCGAVGLWLNAATVLPVIALLGTAAVLVSWWWGRNAVAGGLQPDPTVIRRWGRVGALGSLLFYLLEYAPANFGWRLEVNHPLYAAAWWGGAEIVAALLILRTDPRAKPTRRFEWRIVLGLIAVLAVPTAILIGGAKVFLVADPFVGELRHYIAEGKSLAATIHEAGFGRVSASLAWCAVLLPAGIMLSRRRHDVRLVVGLLTMVTLALVLMSGFEMRWWMSASAAEIALGISLLAALPTASARARWWWIGAVALFALVGPAVRRIAAAYAENSAHAVTEVDLLPPLYRDIARRLRESQPEGPIILLANPDASAGIGYYGRFKSLGTLFWENAPGLRAAAEIFSAETDHAARALIQTRGVTHIAMLSAANFLDGYFRLLHPRSGAADARRSFGQRLLANQPTADWLQPVPYRMPDDLELSGTTVRLYKVVFGQTEYARLYSTILAQAAAGDVAAAEETWRVLSSRVPAPGRAAATAEVGKGLYEIGLDAVAARMYRSFLETRYDPGIANTFAWILATSNDATIRNGRLALTIIEPVLRDLPGDPSVLSSFAAACAELGRFEEAVRAAERALAAAPATGNAAAIPLLQRRLESYRAGRPWRQ